MKPIVVTSLVLIFVAIGGVAWLHHTPQGKRLKAVHFNTPSNTSPAESTVIKKLSLKEKMQKPSLPGMLSTLLFAF